MDPSLVDGHKSCVILATADACATVYTAGSRNITAIDRHFADRPGTAADACTTSVAVHFAATVTFRVYFSTVDLDSGDLCLGMGNAISAPTDTGSPSGTLCSQALFVVRRSNDELSAVPRLFSGGIKSIGFFKPGMTGRLAAVKRIVALQIDLRIAGTGNRHGRFIIFLIDLDIHVIQRDLQNLIRPVVDDVDDIGHRAFLRRGVLLRCALEGRSALQSCRGVFAAGCRFLFYHLFFGLGGVLRLGVLPSRRRIVFLYLVGRVVPLIAVLRGSVLFFRFPLFGRGLFSRGLLGHRLFLRSAVFNGLLFFILLILLRQAILACTALDGDLSVLILVIVDVDLAILLRLNLQVVAIADVIGLRKDRCRDGRHDGKDSRSGKHPQGKLFAFHKKPPIRFSHILCMTCPGQSRAAGTPSFYPPPPCQPSIIHFGRNQQFVLFSRNFAK